jgi:hypothetical protein
MSFAYITKKMLKEVMEYWGRNPQFETLNAAVRFLIRRGLDAERKSNGHS